MRRRWPVLLLLPSLAAASWQTTLVDSTHENTGTTICLGAGGGIVHVAYYSDAGLGYARHDTSGWYTTTLDAWTGPHNRGPSLRLDSLGRPCIAYYRGTPWLARWTGTVWQHEEIDADSSGDYIWLAFDSLGRPHVACNKGGGLRPSSLKYARQDSAGWHVETVDATNSGYDCVLGFDAAGRPVIADCGSWSSGALYYRVRSETAWTRTTLLGAGASQSFLALDPAGQPRISHYWAGGGNYDLRFAWLDGDTWRFEVVDHGLQQNKRGWDNALAVDRRGVCHISYHAHNEAELRYAWGRPGSWTVEVVDTVGLWNLTSSVALDPAGRAFIAYCDENEGDALYLAVRDEPVALGAPPAGPACASPATLVRGVLDLQVGSRQPAASRAELLDISGRKVGELHAGANDVSHLSPGVYFIGSELPTVTRVVLAR